MKYYEYELKSRYGIVCGIFLASDNEIEDLLSKEVYLGEVLGKHSEIYHHFRKCDLKVFEDRKDRVKELMDKYGDTIIGLNPIYEICDMD